MRTKPLYYALFGLAALALIFGGWRVLAGSYHYQGSQIDPPVPAADFTLTDQNEQAFTLSDQGSKVNLIFFGYTNCPDVCPITLTTYARVRARLGEQADQVRFIFITVDPERDTTEQIKTHISHFDPAIIGLTGTRAELEPVWKDYGVFQSQHGGGGVEHYDVDHSSRIYVIDAQGNWRMTYPAEMDWEAIASDVQHMMKVQG
jgi:protein SCO1/2